MNLLGLVRNMFLAILLSSLSGRVLLGMWIRQVLNCVRYKNDLRRIFSETNCSQRLTSTLEECALIKY